MPALPQTRPGRLQLVSVVDLVGGLDRRTSASLLKSERARRLTNVDLSHPGEWRPAKGWQTFTDSSLGSSRIQGGRRVYLSGVDPFTVIAYEGSIYKQPDDGGSASLKVSGFDATNPIDFVADDQFCAAFDGVGTPGYTPDGNKWYQLGIDAPTSAPTLSQSAGGSLINGNVYEVAFAYQNQSSGQPPSNGSPTAQITMGGASRKITAQCAASTDAQVDTIVVYMRNVTAGEEVLRWSASIANPGTGTVSFNITSANWEDGAEIPISNDPAPALTSGVPWKNRWWGFTGTRVQFSELFQSLGWPPDYYIEMPFTSGDTVAAIAPLGDSLIVFGHTPTQAFLIVGQTSLDFEIRPAYGAQGGCYGTRAWCATDGGIMHACAEGVFLFDGVNDRLLSYDIEDDWRAMAAKTSQADAAMVCIVNHRRDKQIHIGGVSIPITGDPGEWVLDLSRSSQKGMAWSTTDRPIGGYILWDGEEILPGLRGVLMSSHLSQGTLALEREGTSADGADLVMDYEGPTFTSGSYVARFISVQGEFEPNDGALSVEVVIDGLSQGAVTVPIGTSAASYGNGTYGVATYGGASRRSFIFDLPTTAEGRNCCVVLTYTGQSTFKMFNYGFTMTTEPQQRGEIDNGS